MATKAKRPKFNNAVSQSKHFEDSETEGKKKKVNALQKNKSTTNSAMNETASDWDVEDYRTEYESDEHWELRRNFMLAHKDRFDEERLVCLAQAFVNMEFMGCKYPSETMLLVAELSKEIAKEFREERAQRLKRTFVSASDAAEQRAKGRKSTNQQQERSTATAMRTGGERLCFGGGEPLNLFDGLRFGSLIIYLAGGRNCLRTSCATCNVKYDERLCEESNDANKIIEVLLNDETIARAGGENVKAAKLAAFKQALLLLQGHCYSIKLNVARDTIKVEKTKTGMSINVTKQSADNLGEVKLDESNKGYRMMIKMGWTGGGLGRLKQGREEPVGYLLNNNRSGLGNPQANTKQFRTLIQNYMNSDDMRDLQFEPTFSKEERGTFHQMSRQFGLRSASYGVGENRRLLITKKVTYNQILTEVLIRRNPKFCDRYFVQVPMQKAHLFPGHVTGLDLDSIND